jgi:hypothetical protein
VNEYSKKLSDLSDTSEKWLFDPKSEERIVIIEILERLI